MDRRRASDRVAVMAPLLAYRIGVDLTDPDRNWHTAYGVHSDGAVLVRPDGYVGWRSASSTGDSQYRFANVVRRLFNHVSFATIEFD